jgi:hypothetical protein
MLGPLADPWIQAQLDAAVAPYVGRLPAEEIAWMRERLSEALATERRGTELVRRAKPRFVEKSGEVESGQSTGAQSDTSGNPSRANKPPGRRSGTR